MEPMELRTLKYFLAVVKEGSISNAAKALDVTQPTLSRQLAALEDELGCKLYTRTHKGIVLTEQGAVLNRYAETIVALADKAEQEITLPSDAVAGVVHIALEDSAPLGVAVRAMANVRAAYPGITFSVSSGTSAVVLDRFAKGQCDVLIESDLRVHENAETLAFAPSAWGVLVRADAPWAGARGIAAADLADQMLIAPLDGLPSAVRDWLAAGGVSCGSDDAILACDQVIGGVRMVCAGLGCLVVHEQLVAPDAFAGVAFVPFEPRIAAEPGMAWHHALPTPQTQIFIDAVKELCNVPAAQTS